MTSRGRAGITHCGRVRTLTEQDRRRFDVWTVRLVCTEKPHDAGRMHYNRWSGLEWRWGVGVLRRRRGVAA